MTSAVAERKELRVETHRAAPAEGSAPEVAAMSSASRSASPRPTRKAPIIAALLLVVVAAGVGAWQWYPRLFASAGSAASPGETTGKAALAFAADKAGGEENADRPPVRLETVPAVVEQRCDVLRLTGSLMADERSAVASNTSGIAAEVLVDRGSLVRKNDVLVQIDPTDAKNKLAEGEAMFNELKARLGLEGDLSEFNPENQPEVRLAKAAADLAAANLRRAQELYEKKVVSAESFDQTKTEHELAVQRYQQALLLIKQAFRACQTAEAKLAILRKAVDDTTIRAPFDGWVAEKHVAVGEQISSGMQATKVVTLVRIDPLRLSLTVPQQDVGRIEPGQTVRFRVDSYPDRMFEARVRFIAPVVMNDTRSMVVEAVAPNPNHELRPGMFVTAELELPRKQPCVLAPVSAVQRTGEVGRVYVVRDGVARAQIVALGESDGRRVEIRSGLAGGEMLVAQPDKVRDGDKVQP